MSEVTASSLGKSAVFGVLEQVWRIGSRFFLTPLIISKIGLAGYGTWTLMFTICTYITMFNESAGMAYIKFTAEYDKKNDYRQLSQIISTGIALIGGFAFIGFASIWAFHNVILHAVDVPSELMSDAALALAIVMISVLISMSGGSVYPILAGIQRLDLSLKLKIFGSSLDFALAIVFLILDYGLVGLAIAHLIGETTAILIGWIIVKARLPLLKISIFSVSAEGLKYFLKLAGRFQILSLLATGSKSSLSIIISALCGITVLGAYELARRLLELGKIVCTGFILPLMPAFANLYAGEQTKRVLSLVFTSSKAVAAMAVVSYTVLLIYADKVLVIWTSQEYPLSAYTIRLLAVGYFLSVLTGVATSGLRGRGLVKLEMKTSLLGLGLVFGSLIPFYLWYGYKGILLSMLLGMLVASSWFLSAWIKQEAIDGAAYSREVLAPVILVGILGIGLGYYSRMLFDGIVTGLSERLNAVVELIGGGGIIAVILVSTLWYALFNESERSKLLAVFKRF